MAGHDIGSGVDIINIVHHLDPQKQTKQKTTLFFVPYLCSLLISSGRHFTFLAVL